MALHKRMSRGVAIVAIGVIAVPAVAWAMAVFDAANFAENQATKLKMIEEVKVVTDTFNEVKHYVTLVGDVYDMAQGFVKEPKRLANEVMNCLNTQTNTAANTVCGKQFNIDSTFFTHPSSSGTVTDVAVAAVHDTRNSRLQDAVKRGLAVPEYLRSDTTAPQALVDLAAEAQSPTSGSAQANITNKLLVELVRQMQLANTIAAASLELQAAQAVKTLPVAIGASTARSGL